MTHAPLTLRKPHRASRAPLIGLVAGVVLVAAMALSTKVVRTDDPSGAVPGVFTPATYGKAQFPKVRDAILAKAVDAATLAAALAKDPAAAAKTYGVAVGSGTEFAVSFKGVAGKEDSGVYDVAVEGVPAPIRVSVQTGPAIMGTDLRDAPGTIAFGQFTNQIDYQNAASALNREMKAQVLSKVDASALAGKTISVIGVFRQGETPGPWLVTPVKLDVAP